MKKDIHPEYHVVQVACACGNKFETRATKAKIHVEICSDCHPFYTGKQKFVDSEGRVERFQRKYANLPAGKEASPKGAAKAAKKEPAKAGK